MYGIKISLKGVEKKLLEGYKNRRFYGIKIFPRGNKRKSLEGI